MVYEMFKEMSIPYSYGADISCIRFLCVHIDECKHNLGYKLLLRNLNLPTFIICMRRTQWNGISLKDVFNRFFVSCHDIRAQ